jgi:AraC-like DNA-binding protein
MRLVRTKQRLKCGVPIVEAALEAGYYDQAHFTRQFAAAYGMTPAQFRRVQGNAARASAEA